MLRFLKVVKKYRPKSNAAGNDHHTECPGGPLSRFINPVYETGDKYYREYETNNQVRQHDIENDHGVARLGCQYRSPGFTNGRTDDDLIKFKLFFLTTTNPVKRTALTGW